MRTPETIPQKQTHNGFKFSRAIPETSTYNGASVYFDYQNNANGSTTIFLRSSNTGVSLWNYNTGIGVACYLTATGIGLTVGTLSVSPALGAAAYTLTSIGCQSLGNAYQPEVQYTDDGDGM